MYIKNSIFFWSLALWILSSAVGYAAQENLNLEDSFNSFKYDGSYGYDGNYGYGGPYGYSGRSNRFGVPSTYYGMGGYGDPPSVNFNANACSPLSVDQSNCTAVNNPGAGQEWRFIKDIGWRKMNRYGAARNDWWTFKRSIGWPVVRDFPRYKYIEY